MKQTHVATQHRASSFQLRLREAALDAHSGSNFMVFGDLGVEFSGGSLAKSSFTRRVGECDGELLDISKPPCDNLLTVFSSARMMYAPVPNPEHQPTERCGREQT
jgi:hypothetical protein